MTTRITPGDGSPLPGRGGGVLMDDGRPDEAMEPLEIARTAFLHAGDVERAGAGRQ